MEVTHHAFFSTRVVTIEHPNTEDLNDRLCELLNRRPALDDRFNMHPDAMNLLRLAPTEPSIEQLRSMFISGAKCWLDAEGIIGVEGLDCLLFTNRLGRGEFTIVHNHPADLVGIYYARTAESNRPPIDPAAGDDYFEAGDGLLVLHDPRLNANLTAVCNRDHVKVFPRPGLMLIFPAYVWHSVTPHHGDFYRIAYSMNFTLRWPPGPSEFHPLP